MAVKIKLSVPYGTIMNEYIEVPDALPKNTRELKKLFDLNCARVDYLKPKPTTRKNLVLKTLR